MRKLLAFIMLAVFVAAAVAGGFKPAQVDATRALTGANATPIIVDSDTTVTGEFFALFACDDATAYSATLLDGQTITSKTIPAEGWRFGTFVSVTWVSGGTLWLYPIQ